MDVFETMEKRRSITAYESKPIPGVKLRKILEAARLAPSARNFQDCQFVVVKKEELRKRIASDATSHAFIGAAPVIIVGVALKPGYVMPCGIAAHPLDVPIAIDHMTLAAVEEGLGSCWIRGFNQGRMKEILCIPNRCTAVVLLSLGYPLQSPRKRLRKPFQKMISYDCFSKQHHDVSLSSNFISFQNLQL